MYAETALIFVTCRGLCAGFAHTRPVCVCQVKAKCQGKEAVVEQSLLATYYVHSFLIMVNSFPSIISSI